MSKTIIVSNRLPLKFSLNKKNLETEASVGGLATGMKSVHKDGKSLWIGWSGLTKQKLSPALEEEVQKEAKKENCHAINLTDWQVNHFYFGFSNRTIWPLFHYFMQYTYFEKKEWEAYIEVNEIFCEEVVKNYEPGDNIWIHDYHLLLLPKMIRERLPEATIGFFNHIPFPSYEVFRCLPWRKEILEGMLGADLIGFHNYEYERHFLDTVNRISMLQTTLNEINLNNRKIKVDSFPMGIDYQKFHETAKKQKLKKNSDTDIQQRLNEHIQNEPDVKLILSIDRLDYTKGIANRIRAFEYFLDKYPEYQRKVRLVMLAVPSRSNVDQYQILKKEVDELVGRINGKYSSVGWTPIWYFYRSMPFHNLIDLYSTCEIALITPIRDGMNLVAKEYIATRTDQTGVLILSEMAGAAHEMNEALIINPNNFEEIADSIKYALSMPEEEQKRRNQFLQDRLKRYNVEKWSGDFMTALEGTKNNNTTFEAEEVVDSKLEEMLEAYNKASNRIFFLDYDGTLVDFVDKPEDAKPTKELLEMVEQLNNQPNTEVILISGRDKETLGTWWNETPVGLIAEHGVWKRDVNKNWEKTDNVKKDWMKTIHPILETFVDRTPGSFIEEKNYSLAFHYRKADPVLGEIRANELGDVLKNLTINDSISVLNGNKVLEIKNSGIDKGRASGKKLVEKNYDFIFAIGDDWTDEFMFRQLPAESITVKVGFQKTSARFYVENTSAVAKILKKFASQS